MSYKRSFRKTIPVHYSGSKTVSVSEGTRSVTVNYSGTVYEDVNVNINVDTRSFDTGVASCNNSVNLLTGAVTAAQTAQIVSIDLNAKQIGSTIVEGFFKTIRTEISQQIMELSQQIDSNLMHLRELAKACEAKKRQMEVDYNRTSNQYLKIFDDLNKELENRIFELNKPAFVFKRNSDNQTARTSGNDLVSTVAVFGKEGGELQAKISTSIAKKRAFDTINQANMYLWKQKKTENTIAQSMLNSNVAASIFAPVCFLETLDEKNQINKKVYQSTLLSQIKFNNIVEDLKAKSWINIPKGDRENIQRYFNTEISNSFSSNSLHDNRVKDVIVKFFNLDSTKSI